MTRQSPVTKWCRVGERVCLTCGAVTKEAK